MKKLLILLGSVSMLAGSATSVVACGNPTKNEQLLFQNAIKKELEQANQITTQKQADHYKKTFDNGEIKIEHVDIALNYTSPTSTNKGLFQVIFTPTANEKYSGAWPIGSSNNVIEYDVQTAFEAAIAEELNYANEIKTRSAADHYEKPNIKDVDITNAYTTPLPNATSTFQAAFNPTPTGIYREAAPRSSNLNIIKFEDPGIQAEFNDKIAFEKKHANEIKTQKQAEDYINDFKPDKITDVKIEIFYIKPTLETQGSFYVVFSPKPGGKYQGALSDPSKKNTFEYDHQIFFEKAIEKELRRANNIKTEKEAEEYVKQNNNGQIKIQDVKIKPTYIKASAPDSPGLFYVDFIPEPNGKYKEANSKQSSQNSIRGDLQAFFEKAIESAFKNAEQVQKRLEANNYKTPIVNDVHIEKKYEEPKQWRPGSFQVTFIPTANGIYKGAKSKQTNKIEIKYEAIHIQEYLDAINPMVKEFESIKYLNDGRNFWTRFGRGFHEWDRLPNGHTIVTGSKTEIPGVEIKYTVEAMTPYSRRLEMELNPIENHIYSDVGKSQFLSKTVN
ncbi:hypothetical protein ELUMI_v1c06630 [Williamsoniiplasma luminosum]|uniref:Lipoprotein n=1 Tax=Williamsoniiplasma luminosum TaxID=214888 RepID=A0A2K8NU58_9MOLU|nr:lipoprotein [Williamsoniiplasma luminosum]ATZ17385.1 hypothetical protein ELUMI_v1c06630 [Williamsoniiplasma luminosum]